MFGFLNLYKPLHWTSHDCVAKARKLLQERRIGHGGTLDPLASGVLPLAVGRATRLLNYLPRRKVYRAVVRLGIQTSTDDLEGEILQSTDTSSLTLESVQVQLPSFLGTVTQIPPQYSAIQKDGKRLYDLARAGIAVEVPRRQVHIFAIEQLDWQSGSPAEIELLITCGEGTYIRAIARDLGHQLRVGGSLAALERQESGGMKLEQSVTLEQLAESSSPSQFLLTPQEALPHLPHYMLNEDEIKDWYYGRALSLSPSGDQSYALVLNAEGECLGLGEFIQREHAPVFAPKVVLPTR